MNKSKIKIMHLTTDSKIGGTENNVIATVTHLDSNRYENIVVALQSGGDLIERLKKYNIEGRILDIKNISDAGRLFRLFRLIRRREIDILHTYLWHANIAGRIIGALAGVPVIVSSERCLDLQRRGWEIRLNRMTAGLCRKIVCVSEQVRQMLINRDKIPADKLVVIHSGVDTERFQMKRLSKVSPSALFPMGLEPGTKIVGTVGRLRQEKGQRYFIEAAARLKGRYNKVKFLIVGDGPQEANLKSLAVQFGLGGEMTFCGYRRNIPEILAVLDIFVLPSLEEGLPLAAMEAMAAGVPVVATDVGGTKELIEHKKTGWLVEKADGHGLSEAIEVLLKDEILARDIAVQARALIESKFNLKKMIQETDNLYCRLLGAGQK